MASRVAPFQHKLFKHCLENNVNSGEPFLLPPLAFLVLMYSNRCSLSIKFQHNLVELSMLGRSCFLRAALGALWGKT